ncbi:hypothetical protein HPP92_027103 [Vanilla planifolia]|uniref:Adaptor protein ClpS core domain-containing protein n=1 Tax=Vanilla planifolia TaxID=51239 RepID=A0A835PCM5_VANPL|nr:hypothetical protein HPP92_027103 [Vanilla planifolia]KAG0449747.1 hypothetical protein HPP92_027194 [Vanilla planifolia]
MATAVSAPIALSPGHTINYRSGEKLSLNKRAICELRSSQGDFSYWIGKSRKITPPYRVILHNDNFNKREYVVQVLMKVIPGMTLDSAVNIMQEAHHNGLSVVIVCAQADAEQHCMQLRETVF